MGTTSTDSSPDSFSDSPTPSSSTAGAATAGDDGGTEMNETSVPERAARPEGPSRPHADGEEAARAAIAQKEKDERGGGGHFGSAKNDFREWLGLRGGAHKFEEVVELKFSRHSRPDTCFPHRFESGP